MTDLRQARYAPDRAAWREARPPAPRLEGPPALHLTPPPGDCERCSGTGEIICQASDQAFRITCPTCGGRG